MRYIKIFIITLIITVVFCPLFNADTIKLKNGRVLKGRIIEIRDSTYTIKTATGTFNVDESQISDVSWEATGAQQDEDFKEDERLTMERLVRKSGWYVMPEIKYMLFGDETAQTIYGKGMPLYGAQFGLMDRQYMLGITLLGGDVKGSTSYYNNMNYIQVPIDHEVFTMILEGAFRWNIGKKPIILPFVGAGLGYGMAFDTLNSSAITGNQSHDYGIFTMDVNFGLELALGSDFAARLEAGFISLPMQNFDVYQLINTGTGYFSAGFTLGAGFMFKF